ncbi:hypothetical protein GCM10009625_20940 [Brachybacterium fresconis]
MAGESSQPVRAAAARVVHGESGMKKETSKQSPPDGSDATDLLVSVVTSGKNPEL